MCARCYPNLRPLIPHTVRTEQKARDSVSLKRESLAGSLKPSRLPLIASYRMPGGMPWNASQNASPPLTHNRPTRVLTAHQVAEIVSH
jgi:hypothetical protein